MVPKALNSLHTTLNIPIKKIVAETKDAVSIYLDLKGKEDVFQYQAGQHILLHVEIGGESLTRAYSLFTAPHEKEVAITVKRVKNGKVSNYINDHFKVDEEIKVSLPRGIFSVNIQPAQAKAYYFFGGGSGITPLLSNIKTILKQEPLSKVYLLYGNRNESSIIHYKTLTQLAQQYVGRLVIQHELETEASIFGKGLISNLLQAKTGWIDRRCILFFLRKYRSPLAAEYFICGPSGMMDNVENVLHDLDIDKNNIHLERFGSDPNAVQKAGDKAVVNKCEVSFQKDGIKKVIVMKGNQTLLNALLEAGEDIDHSCLAGSCASCACRIQKGKIKMDQCYALNETQLKDNFILACQARPLSHKMEVDFDII